MTDAREAARAEFERYDSDGDGMLTPEEVRQANQALGAGAATDPEVTAFIAAADQDRDGRISVEEYKKAFANGLLETPESFDEGYVPFLDALMAIADEDDDAGLELAALLDTLRSEANSERPIKVIGVALGPDADLGALQQIAEATAGSAYSAVDPADLRTVLFDALRQRS